MRYVMGWRMVALEADQPWVSYAYQVRPDPILVSACLTASNNRLTLKSTNSGYHKFPPLLLQKHRAMQIARSNALPEAPKST